MSVKATLSQVNTWILKISFHGLLWLHLLEDRVYVQYDSAPVAVESLSFAVEEGVKVGAPAPLDIKIRKEFPESWIWEVVEDNGCGFFWVIPISRLYVVEGFVW